MDTPTRLINDLDNRTVFWRSLTIAQRRTAVLGALTRLAKEHDIMDGATWNNVKPAWAPRTGSMHGALGVGLEALVNASGMHTGRQTQFACDCGRPVTHVEEIINGNGNEARERLPLCDACHAEFLAMEAVHA